MSNFNEWLFNHNHESVPEFSESAYEAGAASRQAEIEALQRKLKLIEAFRDNQFELLQVVTQQRDSAQVGNIELQKQLNEVQKWAEWHIEDYCMSDNNSAHDRGWHNAACQLINLLRGGKND